MIPLAEGIYYIDLHYLGTDRLIACAVVETPQGLLLVDPGPTVTVPQLKAALHQAGLSLADVHALLLTHIHLDHAGATGAIVAEAPHIQVYVHPIGAPHMVDPNRLLDSARRLYGELMNALWGTVLPVPPSQVNTLKDGAKLCFGGRTLEVAYTPGHASHHVSFLDTQTGIAFVGDTAGMQLTGTRCLLPVTPPPDIQLEAWQESLRRLAQWQPKQLLLTHFGPSEMPTVHLREMAQRLREMAEAVRAALEAGGDEAQQAEAFHAQVMAALRACVQDEALLTRYEGFGQPRVSWQGLARYWRRKLQTSKT
ncbi:MBL fold metallo-hydrolase [Rhodothermus bifroesti]|uniref:MBL fold metallo-hydrolase n=1 Tax=Rhodothermus bifroesti TaxID=2823335 RepID=UPI001AEF4344|nr:MBL fold metallo-hydrolase [Rhodothermus bifroesti]